MLKVYFASKINKRDYWKSLCLENDHFIAHARWLKQVGFEQEQTPANMRVAWMQDEEDVMQADVVVVYGEKDEHLRGALVEAGMAIAFRVPVIVVGDHPDFGTWQHHPGVKRAADLDEAIRTLHRIKPRYEKRWEVRQ